MGGYGGTTGRSEEKGHICLQQARQSDCHRDWALGAPWEHPAARWGQGCSVRELDVGVWLEAHSLCIPSRVEEGAEGCGVELRYRVCYKRYLTGEVSDASGIYGLSRHMGGEIRSLVELLGQL